MVTARRYVGIVVGLLLVSGGLICGHVAAEGDGETAAMPMSASFWKFLGAESGPPLTETTLKDIVNPKLVGTKGKVTIKIEQKGLEALGIPSTVGVESDFTFRDGSLIAVYLRTKFTPEDYLKIVDQSLIKVLGEPTFVEDPGECRSLQTGSLVWDDESSSVSIDYFYYRYMKEGAQSKYRIGLMFRDRNEEIEVDSMEDVPESLETGCDESMQ